MFGAVPERTPWLGGTVIVQVKLAGAVSTSLPESVTEVGVSSGVETVLLSAVGLSLTGLTVIVIVSTALERAAVQDVLGAPQLSGSPRSVTWKVNVSVPLKFAAGV